jgi:ankyrin repeat protein
MFCKAFETIMRLTSGKDYDSVPILTMLASKWRPAKDQHTTPLNIAVINDDIDLMESLLKIPSIKESVNQPVREGKTAIFHASGPDVLLPLLKAGADMSHVDRTGQSCLATFAQSMNASIKHTEFHRNKHWPSTEIYQRHALNIRIYSDMLHICVLSGADPAARLNGDNAAALVEMVGQDCAEVLQTALAQRVKLENTINATRAAFYLGPFKSYLALLPKEIIDHIIILMRQPLEILIESLASSQ